MAGLQGQTIVGVRTIQESYHDVGIGSPVDSGTEERTSEPVLAQLGLHISGGETRVLVSHQRSLSVGGYRQEPELCVPLLLFCLILAFALIIAASTLTLHSVIDSLSCFLES